MDEAKLEKTSLEEEQLQDLIGTISSYIEQYHGGSVEIVAPKVLPGGQLTNCLQQLQGIEVKDAFCLLMVAYGYGITGKTEDISYAPGVGQEKVSLKRHAVTVTARHLHNGLATQLFDGKATTQRGKSHY